MCVCVCSEDHRIFNTRLFKIMSSNLTVNDHTKTQHRRRSLTEMRQMHMRKILWQMTNGLYPSLKHSFQQYKVHNHCTLLEILVVFSLCAAAAVSVTPTNSAPAAPIDNSPPPTPCQAHPLPCEDHGLSCYAHITYFTFICVSASLSQYRDSL